MGERKSLPWVILWPLTLAVVVYGITGVPYAIGFLRPPAGTVFGGLLDYFEDQDMYFSYIRQGADGHYLFVNRLTSLDHDPVFLNPQWWLVGRIMAWLGYSSQWAYQIWRAAGAMALLSGFYALTQVVLHDRTQRRLALLMCAFGGGFMWLFSALERLRPVLAVLPTLKTGFGYPLFMLELHSGQHALLQIMQNPHFSLPHGLFLFFFASYILGELTGGARWYGIAAAFAVLEGMIRPYDLITLYATIPLFLLIELALTRELDVRKLALRVLPIATTSPIFFYNIYLFKFHPVFKYWASQPVVPSIPIHWYFLSFGLAGVLAVIRLGLAKMYPLRTAPERLLLAWMVAVLLLVLAPQLPMFRFVTYSAQCGTTLITPVILLGVVVIDPAKLAWRDRRAVVVWNLIAVAIVAISALGNSAVLLVKKSRDVANDFAYYITINELDAYKWIDGEARDKDVVLCTRATGHGLARYASVRVALGHYSVTPHSSELDRRVEQFYRGEMTPQEAKEFLEQLGVTWIYMGCNERKLGDPHMEAITGIEKRFINQDVAVFSYGRGDRPERFSHGSAPWKVSSNIRDAAAGTGQVVPLLNNPQVLIHGVWDAHPIEVPPTRPRSVQSFDAQALMSYLIPGFSHTF